jgi:hypothetical protein
MVFNVSSISSEVSSATIDRIGAHEGLRSIQPLWATAVAKARLKYECADVHGGWVLLFRAMIACPLVRRPFARLQVVMRRERSKFVIDSPMLRWKEIYLSCSGQEAL